MITLGINFKDEEYELLRPDLKIEECLKKLGIDYELFRTG